MVAPVRAAVAMPALSNLLASDSCCINACGQNVRKKVKKMPHLNAVTLASHSLPISTLIFTINMVQNGPTSQLAILCVGVKT